MKNEFLRPAQRLLAAFAAAAITCPVSALAAGADDYPTRPIRLLTANSPGGSADQVLRGVGEVLTQQLGQPSVVENKPGGEGVIAGDACARAAADGYTLCMFDSFNWTLLPRLKKKLPYDTTQMTPIMMLGFIPAGFWVHPSIKARSVAEFVQMAKAQPGMITLGSWGRASTPYLYGELLRHTEGAQFNTIPYKSPTQAWQALNSGEVKGTTYTVRGGMPFLKDGKVKLLAVNTAERMPELPEVPTFAEAGLPVVTTWLGLFAPPKTPPDIVEKLNRVLAKAIFEDEATRKKLLTGHIFAVYGPAGRSPQAFSEYLSEQSRMFDQFLETAQVSPE